jgi:hypothetical protein
VIKADPPQIPQMDADFTTKILVLFLSAQSAKSADKKMT